MDNDSEKVEEKISAEDEKISSEENSAEENFVEEEKITEKKISAEEKKNKSILDELNGNSNLIDKAKDFFLGMTEDISKKYILAVAGGVLFFIILILAVLIFVEPDTVKTLEKNISPNQTETAAEKRIHIKITSGMSTGEIADQLESKGVITSSLKFRILSRIRGYDDKMKLGTYVFSAGMTDEEVFTKILSGEKYIVTLTIPEGFGVKDIANRLYEIDLADKEDFLEAAKDFAPYPYMKKHDNVIFAAEGFLFPETYTVESDASVEDILKMMAAEFDKKLTLAMREKAKEMGLSVYDLITLASLVEREVRSPVDRPIVAQVFLKRLKMNMPLQTDASLQYLMDAPKEDVSIEDTQIESPYNTYLHAGLPPGPIASPGIESIKAVLNPADTDFLYFVADREGHNHYSNSYEEHLELVNQYR